MIRIYKGDNQTLVTKGAYENFYKPLGYYVMDSEKKVIVNDIKAKETKAKETKAKKIKNYKRK